MSLEHRRRVSVPQGIAVTGTSTVSASQSSTSEPATQAVQHLSRTRIPTKQAADGNKLKYELLTRLRYFRIPNTENRIDALHIY